MKIGILCHPTYGGSGIVATELGMFLAEKGNEVHFMSFSIPVRLDMTRLNIYFHKINVEEYPLFNYQPYDVALSSTIFQVVKMYGLEIIHVQYAIPYAYAAYVAKQMLREEGIKISVITTLHGTDITLLGKHPSYKNAVEFSINHSDFVTSVSESLKRETHQYFNINKDILVIPNFIDISDFENIKKSCDRARFADPEEKILIHVSNLRQVKRIQDVLSVFEKVQQEIPSRLIIIGEGPEMEVVNNFLGKNPDLVRKVKILGKLNEFYPILKFSDIFLLPSEQESFGLAALEAMALETAVVSSNAGGIPEVNIHGKTGFLAEVGDVDAMAEYTKKLLLNTELLATMKKNARETARKFDIKNILPLYEDLYKRAINKKDAF